MKGEKVEVGGYGDIKKNKTKKSRTRKTRKQGKIKTQKKTTI